MREKSKELQRLRDDSNKRGGGGGMKSMNSMGSGGYSGGGPSPMASMASSIQVDIPKTTYQPPMPSVLFLIHIIRYLFIKYSKPFLFINFENHYLSKNRNSSFCYYYLVVKKKREFFFDWEYFADFRKANGPSKALKLGGRSKDAENFVDQLKSEGEHVTSPLLPSSAPVTSNKLPPATILTESYVTIYSFKFFIHSQYDHF